MTGLGREERQELRRLADAATSGPWGWGYDGIEGCAFVSGPEIPPLGVQSPHGITVMSPEDAAFIEAARDAVPSLLDALDAAERANEQVRAEVRRIAPYEHKSYEQDAQIADLQRENEQLRRERDANADALLDLARRTGATVCRVDDGDHPDQ